MKCEDKNCKRKVHFVSPEFSQFFKYAIVDLPGGEKKFINLPIPIYYINEDPTKGFQGFGKWPVGSSNDCKLVYELGKSGVQENDPYFLEMNRIEEEYEIVEKSLD